MTRVLSGCLLGWFLAGGASQSWQHDTRPVAVGLSDLAEDSQGRLWAVPERRRELVMIAPGRTGGFAGGTLPIEGVGEGVDTEAMVFLPPSGGSKGAIALATETQDDNRSSDAIMIASQTPEGFRVTSTLQLPYSLWGIKATKNRGIEGLCQIEGRLIAGVETAIVEQDKRYAPLAIQQKDGTFLPYRLALTHPDGKLSALACTKTAEGIVLYAIERHYTVMRVLRAVVAEQGPRDLASAMVFDLADRSERPNFEGLVVHGSDAWLLSDNDTGGVTGPAVLAPVKLGGQ